MNLVKNTIGHLFLNRVELTPNKNAIGFFKDKEIISYTFIEYKKNVEALSLALLKKGIINQDRVCILSNTRIEWNFMDLAILCAGAITVPIYQTYNAPEIEYIANHTEAKMIILEDREQFDKVFSSLEKLESLKYIISFEKLDEEAISKIPSTLEYYSFDEFLQYGRNELVSNPDTFEIKVNGLHDNNIATIIYTSGTTGNPKGAVITQGSLIKMLKNIKSFTNNALSSKDTNLSFLPLAHVLGRCDSFLNITFGCYTVYAESIEKLLVNIQKVKPTFMIAVPRIFEKIYEKVQKDLESSSFLKKNMFNWAMAASNDYFETIQNDRTPSTKQILEFNLANKLVNSKIYDKFGGKVRYFISGGAPLSKDIIRFLTNAGLTLVEGYGLTETIGPSILNPFEKQKAGTVGKPVGDVEVKFGDDSEILIRTKAMLKEYYKNEEATKESIDEDGWFHTGDIGQFDAEGYLTITDRKKDIIITSGGKNVAPQKIENKLKLTSLVEQCVIVGDQKKYLTALIGVTSSTLKKDKSETVEIIQKSIDKVNLELAQFETIKKFQILPVELTTDNYLTPSLKVKKKLLIEDFKDLIDSMYHQ